jgi:hypothetical protein
LTSYCSFGADSAGTVDGVNSRVRVSLTVDYGTTGSGSQSTQLKMYACNGASVSYSGTPPTCSGTDTLIYATNPSTNNNGYVVSDTLDFIFDATSLSAGQFMLAMTKGSYIGAIGTGGSAQPSLQTCSGCSSSSWILHWTVTFGGSGAGSTACGSGSNEGLNCLGITSVYAKPEN